MLTIGLVRVTSSALVPPIGATFFQLISGRHFDLQVSELRPKTVWQQLNTESGRSRQRFCLRR